MGEDIRKMIDKVKNFKQFVNENKNDIHEYNGKKYKKQTNGKWLEVSDSHGLTKTEHNYAAIRNKSKEEMLFFTHQFSELSDTHRAEASKLSDKEYSNKEVGL